MFMGSCFDQQEKEMLIVMEFMSKGSFHDVLHNSKIALPYSLQLHMALQAAQGMYFLHNSKPPILHCDLKSHNILLDDKWSARISDFGITRFKQETKQSAKEQGTSTGNSIGTIFWTSPEVLEGAPHSEASDCYSFGVVLWEIFHRMDPYPGKDSVAVAVDVMQKGIRPEINPNTPSEIRGIFFILQICKTYFYFADLIQDCWQQNPAKRLTFDEITNRLRHFSMKNPVYNFSSHDPRTEAPAGLVYLVHAVR